MIFGGNVMPSGHWQLTGECPPIRNKNEVWLYNNWKDFAEVT